MKRSNRGFTLIELLIAMGLLVIFTLLLVQVLSQAIYVWQNTESKRQILETSRDIMDIISDDLESLYANTNIGTEVKFLLDRDKLGRHRLRFIRKLNEKKHPVLRNSGKGKDFYTLTTNETKKLRASGGLAEIFYCISPTKKGMELWRGIRTPIGGKGSFFNDKNIDTDEKIRSQCHKIADKVMLFHIKCWAYNTSDWDGEPSSHSNVRGGPSLLWDSTRNRLTDFHLFSQQKSLSTIFPLKLQITLVVQNGPPTNLTKSLEDTDDICEVEKARGFPLKPHPGRFLLIENEWISYENINDNQFTGLQRGIWSTSTKPHHPKHTITHTYYEDWDSQKTLPKTYETEQRTKVYGGIPFTKTIVLPTYYETLRR